MSETASTSPSIMKRSRAKIWIRTVILAVFGTLFTIYLVRDINGGAFQWYWAVATFLALLPIGFWMRTIVPMQVHVESKSVTFSFDKPYFILIWVLVIAKALTGQVFHLVTPSDVLMCVILGLMFGRLSGICLRVRRLKVQNGFVTA
jgi:hypothetical protein